MFSADGVRFWAAISVFRSWVAPEARPRGV